MEYTEFILFILFIVSVFSFFSLAPWLPTKKTDYKRINDILKLQKSEHFLEIWCGTAGVLLYVAKNNPNSTITGIELSPLFFILSRIRVALSRYNNITILYGNALKIDFKQFDAIYIFALPETITKKIVPKLSQIIDRKFRMVSYCFQMKNSIFIEKKYKPIGSYSIYEYKIKN